MGEPPGANSGEPDVWVNARQYTGRIVNVTNDKIFDTPAHNYTREFPYMWEEMHFPITYDEDWKRAESIPVHGVRNLKDTITREIDREFRSANLSIASTTFAIVGMPDVRIARAEERR
jgi:hypothetical protein